MTQDTSSIYLLQEGQINIPDGFTDRTVNVFSCGKPGSAFALNIARDVPEQGETLEEYVTRQTGMLKKHLRGYQVTRRDRLTVGEQKKDAEQVDASYMADGRKVWQRQLALLRGEIVLIFTATSTVAFTAKQDQQWAQWVESFRPWPSQGGSAYV